MRREEQERENRQALNIWYAAGREFNNERPTKSKRLRTMSARVFETSNYYILKSYDTFIACIDKDTKICSDVLRNVYGYTPTSAKHVNAFGSDFGAYRRVTWRTTTKRLSPDEEVERGLDLM